MTAIRDLDEQPIVAETIARIAHRMQVDKGGKPYIGHPARVAAALAASTTRHMPELVAVGWLHDVLEDTSLTRHDLEACGLTSAVIDAVVAITRLGNEEPPAYYARVKENWLAARVKAADIADNTNPDRLALIPDDATIVRLTRKYARARQLLGIAA